MNNSNSNFLRLRAARYRWTEEIGFTITTLGAFWFALSALQVVGR
jgi:hypothetical protein